MVSLRHGCYLMNLLLLLQMQNKPANKTNANGIFEPENLWCKNEKRAENKSDKPEASLHPQEIFTTND